MTQDTTPTVRPTRRTEVRQFVDPDQLKTDLGFSMADLTSAMMNQSSFFVHYGVYSSMASRQVDDLKLLVDVAEAKAYRIARDEAVKAGGKTTEAQLANVVSTSPSVLTLRHLLNEAKQVEANTKIAVEGFRHRRDMLVQLGLLAREEIKGEVSINRRNAISNEQEGIKDRVLARLKEADPSTAQEA
jgi:hypothetical protein